MCQDLSYTACYPEPLTRYKTKQPKLI